MNIKISARKTTVKDSFREKVEKKLSKLERFFSDDANATVVISNVRDRETVEVTVQSRGMIFRAERTTDDRLTALDDVIDSLTRQIVKNKSKLERKGKTKPISMEGFETYTAELSDDVYELVKTKQFELKPMSSEEAILQMNLLDHHFFMFENEETGKICVVYRRKDGDYGMLEPQFD